MVQIGKNVTDLLLNRSEATSLLIFCKVKEKNNAMEGNCLVTCILQSETKEKI